MCGIAGLLDRRETEPGTLVSSMIASIRYRGPDDRGVWCDPNLGLALGHARLSILDLSQEGYQPMSSPSGRFVLAYNGEVYNHAVLRSELEGGGARFRGHSDTEVMLAAFEAWGFVESMQRFVGMFAFALWDRVERQLILARVECCQEMAKVDRSYSARIYYKRKVEESRPYCDTLHLVCRFNCS